MHPLLVSDHRYTIKRGRSEAAVYFGAGPAERSSRVELDTYFWQLAVVDLEASSAVADDLRSCARREAFGVLLRREDVERVWPPLGSGGNKSEKSPGGRPPGTDWEAVALEIVRISRREKGVTQAELIRRILDWLSDNSKDGKVIPAESTVKEHVKPFHELLWSKT